MIVEDWKQFAQVKLSEMKVKYSKAHDDHINKEIERCMKENNNNPYPQDIAENLFQSWWEKIIELPLLKNIKEFKDLSDYLFGVIKKSYEACTTQLTNDINAERGLKLYINGVRIQIIYI